jgi:catechol 2,3-dioxygenase-like lactoylglutathione lyase family enzyme
LNIFDHIGFNVADFERSEAFYTQALAPLGIVVVKQEPGWAMKGRDGRPQFWFGAFGPSPGRIHLAFTAADRAQVIAFYHKPYLPPAHKTTAYRVCVRTIIPTTTVRSSSI